MQTLQDKLRSLPLEIQDAITSTEFSEKVDAIGDKHNLHIDQLGELVNEVALVMLGETKSADFLENIIKSLKISEDEAKFIVSDVNNDIFLPLRESLQQEKVPNENTEPHHLETPEEILKHIEDGGLELPAPEKIEAKPIPEPEPIVQPEPVVVEPIIETKKEPEKPAPQSTSLTDHLLKNTVASPHVEEKKVEKKYTIDPYREPIM